MDFDFKNLYANYSNVALLKIIATPQNYQQDAVTAAQEILATRDITDADTAAVDRELFIPKTPATMPPKRQEELHESGIFDDEILPAYSQRFFAIKWSIFGLIALQIIGITYNVLEKLYFAVLYSYLPIDFSDFLIDGILCAIAITGLYFFAIGRKIGWILISLVTLYNVANRLIFFLASIRAEHIGFGPIHFLILFLNLGILSFLQKPELYDHYVDDAAFTKIRLWAVIGAVAYFAVGFFFRFIFIKGASF